MMPIIGQVTITAICLIFWLQVIFESRKKKRKQNDWNTIIVTIVISILALLGWIL